MINPRFAAYALLAGLTLSLLGMNHPAVAAVAIEVLNPRGEIELDEVYGISPRVPELAGKTIGLYSNGKGGVTQFLDMVEANIKEKYPTATIKRYGGAFDVGDQLAKQIAGEVNAVVYGLGD
jgi:hypothetical protein